MCFFRIGNAIPIGIALQLLHDARAKLLAGRRVYCSDDGCKWRCAQMAQRELIQMGQMDIDPADAHLDAGKARSRCKMLQFLSGGGLAPAGEELDGGFVADVPGECFTNGTALAARAVPYAERETAAMLEHATHVPQRERLVGKELQPLLAENRVEAGIRQSKIERAALDPLDRCSSRCRERSRDGEHPGVQIDTNDVPTGTDALRRSASHDASPASNIQHALALRKPSAVDEQRRPGCEDVSSDVALVQFSGLPGQLPRLVLVRLACHLCYGARVRSRPLRVSSLESTNSVAI